MVNQADVKKAALEYLELDEDIMPDFGERYRGLRLIIRKLYSVISRVQCDVLGITLDGWEES